jgi:hypothetical protein
MGSDGAPVDSNLTQRGVVGVSNWNPVRVEECCTARTGLPGICSEAFICDLAIHTLTVSNDRTSLASYRWFVLT